MSTEKNKGPADCPCGTPTDLVSHNKCSIPSVPCYLEKDNTARHLIPAERIDFLQFSWLTRAGVNPRLILELDPIVVRGLVGDDGLFVLDPHGQRFLAFAQGDDLILWQPRASQLTSLWGDAFALGEEIFQDAIDDGELVLFSNPLDWLRQNCRGIVVVDWSRAFQLLSVLRHVNVPEVLLPRYQAAMSRPMPKVHPYSKLQVQK